MDKPSLQKAVIRIAFTLKSWGFTGPVVQQILGLLDNSRFNGIKYNLKDTLNK